MTSSNSLPENYIVFCTEIKDENLDFAKFAKTQKLDIGPRIGYYYAITETWRDSSSIYRCNEDLKAIREGNLDSENWPIYTIAEWRILYNKIPEYYEIF